MLAIELYAELCFSAVEIEPVGQHWIFPPELESDTAISHKIPNDFFGNGWEVAGESGSLNGTFTSVRFGERHNIFYPLMLREFPLTPAPLPAIHRGERFSLDSLTSR